MHMVLARDQSEDRPMPTLDYATPPTRRVSWTTWLARIVGTVFGFIVGLWLAAALASFLSIFAARLRWMWPVPFLVAAWWTCVGLRPVRFFRGGAFAAAFAVTVCAASIVAMVIWVLRITAP